MEASGGHASGVLTAHTRLGALYLPPVCAVFRYRGVGRTGVGNIMLYYVIEARRLDGGFSDSEVLNNLTSPEKFRISCFQGSSFSEKSGDLGCFNDLDGCFVGT